MAWSALGALLIVGAAFLFHEMRHTTLWFDEWQWALERRGNDLRTFLAPHNGHFSLVPVALYKLLFATAGLDDFTAYRAMGIGAHLLCVALVFAYARPRVGGLVALLAAVLILTLGPGWQNILWPFQVGSLISIAAGIGALLMLDRADRRGDAAACGLVALSLASSGLGIVVAIGVAVDVLWGRRDLRAAWIIAGPAGLYALWWLGYQDSGGITRHNLVLTPGFVADAAAGALSAVTGLAVTPVSENGTAVNDSATLGWGRPLAVGTAALLAWRFTGPARVSPRTLTLLAMLLSYWTLTGLQRAQVGPPDSSRYLYVGAVFIVLIAVELARGVAPSRRALPIVALGVVVASIANLGDLREGARYLRAQAAATRADLGALELSRPLLRPDSVAWGFPGTPIITVRAGPYFAAARELGTPAANAAAIATAPEPARLTADAELARAHRVSLRPTAAGLPAGSPPAVDAAAGGTVTPANGCLEFRPADTEATGATREVQFTLPPDGVLLTAEGGSASVSVRRFAAGFPPEPAQRLAGGASATLRIEPDGAAQPWHVRVSPEGRVTACGLAEIP